LAAARFAGASSTPDSDTSAAEADPRAHRRRLLNALGVPSWHTAGHRGRGLKVAVLDSGFRGYKAHLGQALPARVLTRSFRKDGNLEARDSQHGILCGEVIHAVAPDAELLFANWEPDDPAQFLKAVQWARQMGARVISCSVIMPTWSDGEGHGAVHEALRHVLGPGDRPGDVLCFASAGNTAQRHWSGVFRDAGDGRHEWARGQCDNVLWPWGGERVSVELCWSDRARYELTVRDVTARRPVGEQTVSVAADRCSAVVRFTPQTNHAYTVAVRLLRGKPGAFHLVALGGALQYVTTRGSIPFPGDGPEVVAVAAVDGDGHRWSYSSCGPTSGQPKPDLAANVPFPSLWRARPFSGTSAAAPQAAALAALVWSCHPDWTARKVREALCAAARHHGPGRHDCETGFGCIHLP
jgi:hypothetical protein